MAGQEPKGDPSGSTRRQPWTARSTPFPWVIAHRGFAGTNPENTTAAMRRATADETVDRPDAVEIDVMPSADGEVVVFHDFSLARVTDAPPALLERAVWEVPYEHLGRLDVLGTGEGVPTLSTILEAVPPDVAVNVELKTPGTDDLYPGRKLTGQALAAATERWRPFVDRVLAAAAGHPHDLLVSSFCEAALAAVRDVDRSVPIASVFAGSIDDGLSITREHDCEAIHVPLKLLTGPTTDERERRPRAAGGIDLVDLAHGEGRVVNAWTVKTWREAADLRTAGVDGIIADYPGLLR